MGVKISELNEATSAQNSDVLPIVQNGETKKISVETLGIANAVEKTGDTMTGNLDMQSNSVKFGNDGNILFKEDGYGDKFRIIPNFNGAGADNKLIIQSTTGEAGTDPQNWKDLVTIHADSGQVDLIHPTAWTNATLSQNVRGTIRYFKVGKMVVVQIQDLSFSVDVSHGFVFATGLPKSIEYTMGILISYDSQGKLIRVAATADGQIVSHYTTVPKETKNYYGYLIYIAQD